VAIVDYQYATACAIMTEVETLAGEDRMRAIVRSLLFRWPKYTGAPIEGRGKPDWREFLDAVDELGLVPAGVEDLEVAERLLLAEGIASRKLLEGRAAARAAFHDAANGALESMLPRVVSTAMDAWDWQRALAGIEIAMEAAERIGALTDRDGASSETIMASSRLRTAASLAELRKVRDGLKVPS
jgi:hypothetical protein